MSYKCSHCFILSFCLLRSGSGHHRCQSGQPRDAAAYCESAPWTFRTASGRKPEGASWLPSGLLLSDRTQLQRGQTASRSTSLKPRHGSEVHRFSPGSPHLTTDPTPSLLYHCFNIHCHSPGRPYWSYTRQFKCLNDNVVERLHLPWARGRESRRVPGRTGNAFGLLWVFSRAGWINMWGCLV